jgi:hypothetical protein
MKGKLNHCYYCCSVGASVNNFPDIIIIAQYFGDNRH